MLINDNELIKWNILSVFDKRIAKIEIIWKNDILISEITQFEIKIA